MRTRVALALSLCAITSITTSVFAHHSHTAFDVDKKVTIEGTITQVNWGNPHLLMIMEGKQVDQPDAAVMKWSLEGPSPTQLTKFGWTRDTLRVGDKITVSAHPSRRGRPYVLMVQLSAGQHYFALDNSPVPCERVGNRLPCRPSGNIDSDPAAPAVP